MFLLARCVFPLFYIGAFFLFLWPKHTHSHRDRDEHIISNYDNRSCKKKKKMPSINKIKTLTTSGIKYKQKAKGTEIEEKMFVLVLAFHSFFFAFLRTVRHFFRFLLLKFLSHHSLVRNKKRNQTSSVWEASEFICCTRPIVLSSVFLWAERRIPSHVCLINNKFVCMNQAKRGHAVTLPFQRNCTISI